MDIRDKKRDGKWERVMARAGARDNQSALLLNPGLCRSPDADAQRDAHNGSNTVVK